MTKIALHSNTLLLGWFKKLWNKRKKCAQFVGVDSFNSEQKVEKGHSLGVVVSKFWAGLWHFPVRTKQTNLNKIDALTKGVSVFPGPPKPQSDRQVTGKLGPTIPAICRIWTFLQTLISLLDGKLQINPKHPPICTFADVRAWFSVINLAQLLKVGYPREWKTKKKGNILLLCHIDFWFKNKIK